MRPVYHAIRRLTCVATGAAGVVLQAHAAADFSVTVRLRPPDGCTATLVNTGTGGAAQVTLICGSNLFVNVQPTIVTSPTPSTPTGTSPVASFTSATVAGSANPPPAELPQSSIASLMNLNDTSTSVGGALFVQRRASTATGNSGDAGREAPGGGSIVSPGSVPGPNNASNNTSGLNTQGVEMWLIF